MTDAKSSILRQIYYSDDGFDSKLVTFKKAKEIIPNITQKEVNDWFDKQSSYQLKAKRGFNSYVADHKLQQIHADLADFRQGGGEYKYALIAIDIFSKFVVGVPMKGKTASDCRDALEIVIQKFGRFEELYTDSEPGFQSTVVVRLFNQHGIKHIATYGKAFFAEKAIHTIKMGIHNRLQGLHLDPTKWQDVMSSVINKYNRTVHSTIKMTPIMAMDDKNKVEVWLNIYQKAKQNRLYEKFYVGDKARIAKPRTFTKGHDPRFSKEVYTVIHAANGGYLVNNPDHKRVWLRHELLKIADAEDKDS